MMLSPIVVDVAQAFEQPAQECREDQPLQRIDFDDNASLLSPIRSTAPAVVPGEKVHRRELLQRRLRRLRRLAKTISGKASAP